MSKVIRPIAIYLPQFHPVPENDVWWGKGFTEWTNVVKSRPKFKGHYQPHLPADLGFYDLRLEETRIAQAEMAKSFGIYGFCYYHYWFNGRRILERPFEEVLHTGKPDFPFCLCWANENWTRRWDGDEHEILLKQEYNIDDDRNHMKHLCSAFRDPRYIRIDGKPVFSVYRTMLLPNIRKTVETWRETARKEGIGEIYLCRMESISQKIDPVSIGFDAAIEFQPDLESLQARNWGSLFKRALNKVKIKGSPFLKNMVYEYSEVVKNMIAKSPTNYKLYPGITPGWDNSARRQEGALIFNNSTPELYESWLNNIVKSFRPFSTDENFIFINAWNEWAEGNHLEPCKRWGTSYLEATKRVVEIYNSNNA